MPRYLIIGAGVFGASTALHTKKEEPSADVLLFDHTPSYVTPASVDINKIVRTQYAAREYHELANEAVKAWLQTDFVDLYNKSGWIIIGGSGGEGSLGHSDDQNARMLVGGDPRWSPIFSFPEDQMAVWDPEPAWVDATSALERTVTLACKAGVKYKRAAVSTLILSGNRCIGVRLADGEDITGDRILLSMGPWTAPFLARHSSLPNFAEQCVNAGASSATITVDKAQEHLYRNMPILVCHPNGEIMPMDRKRRIKVTNAITFTNSELGSLGPSELGDPRSHLFEENRALLSKFLPQFSETPFSEVRYCYDFVTQSQNFIISPVPNFSGLFVATGGSYHGFKFLPTVGKYVWQMMNKALPQKYRDLWAWVVPSHQAEQKGVHDGLFPQRIYSDIQARFNSLPGV